MALTFTEFESYKLNTEFNGNYYTHTIPCAPGTSPTGGQVRVEKWKRIERVGGGAFGTVWKEKSTQSSELRAVKQIHKSQVKNTGEMLALTKMNSYSQYFVEFLGWFQDDEHIYLAMEFLECDLERHITDVSMSEKDLKSVTTQLLEGLKIMHGDNFCHRDLKPQNILVAKWYPLTVKIADFGISKQAGDKTMLKTFAGSHGYAAPEILGFLDTNTSEYTNAVDIWSLGCLVYAMITKETPFPGGMGLLDYVQGRAPFPKAKLENSTAIEFIISLMMPHPQDRLTAEKARNHSWLALEQDTETFWEEYPNAATPTSPEPKRGQITPNPAAIAENKPQDQVPTSPVIAEKSEPRNDVTVSNSNTIPTKLGQALITAASNGHIDLVQLMLDKGADIAAGTDKGETSLHLSAANGHKEVVKLLLEKGADITKKNLGGFTALHYAAWNGHTELVGLLLEAGADATARNNIESTPLSLSADKGHKEVVQLLLEKGSKITERTVGGFTALHWAAQNGHTELVRWLLEAGADITARSTTESTPLLLSAENGHKEVLQLLLEKGAKITDRDYVGWTALHRAAKGGHIEVIKFLLEVGADIVAKNLKEDMPLHIAADCGQKEVLLLLLEKGVNIMERGQTEYTALHWAAQNGHTEVIRFLLERGADTTVRDGFGYTPLERAARNGYKEALLLLVELDAETVAKDTHQPVPLITAASTRHEEPKEPTGLAGALGDEDTLVAAVNNLVVGKEDPTVREDEEPVVGGDEGYITEGEETITRGEEELVVREEEIPVFGQEEEPRASRQRIEPKSDGSIVGGVLIAEAPVGPQDKPPVKGRRRFEKEIRRAKECVIS